MNEREAEIVVILNDLIPRFPMKISYENLQCYAKLKGWDEHELKWAIVDLARLRNIENDGKDNYFRL